MDKKTSKPTKLEAIKQTSQQLRGNIAETYQGGAGVFGDADKQLLKFHGVYQQDDRDLRGKGNGKAFSFMVRSRIPGGVLSAAQYLTHDDLAERYANKTLRITTRQDFQLHGVLHGPLAPTLRGLNQALVTTLGACGDVVRNVMCCPIPATDPLRREVLELARRISAITAPRTRAYHEIWLNGEKAVDGRENATDELYGETYLPRKFKLAIAMPGDNCVDVFTQDLGLIVEARGSTIVGYHVLVGGGLGMTHKKPGTFPRLADPLAFVEPSMVLPVVEQIVRVQRDHGDRTDRRHARLKYLIHDRGIDWFRDQVQRGLGVALAPPRETPQFSAPLHHGWGVQESGKSYRGIFVENGRIGIDLRNALSEIVQRFQGGVTLTPNQDLMLTDLPTRHRFEIDRLLLDHGVVPEKDRSAVRLRAMACPAMPTCGLALAEAERTMPSLLDELEQQLDQLGLGDEKISVRMTGCPNGCARPYVADLAFVGRSRDRYVIFVGGRSDGTRLNEPLADLVPRELLVERVVPLLKRFRDRRFPGESFGDFCHRVGTHALRQEAAVTQADSKDAACHE